MERTPPKRIALWDRENSQWTVFNFSVYGIWKTSFGDENNFGENIISEQSLTILQHFLNLPHFCFMDRV